MRIIKITILLIILFLISSNPHSSTYKQVKNLQVSPGVNYLKLVYHNKRGSTKIHILKIDIYNYSLTIKPALAWDTIGRLEKLSSLCKRKNAIAGINGSFFSQVGSRNYPVGYLVLDGEIIFKSDIRRTSLGITTSREIIMGIFKPYIRVRIKNLDASFLVGGVNRPRPYNGIILYNHYFGKKTETTSQGQEIVIRKGKSGEYFVSEIVENNADIPQGGFVLSFDKKCAFIADWFVPRTEVWLDIYLEDSWAEVEHLLTAGPRLVSNSQITIKSKEEGFKPSFSLPNSRSAVALTSNDKLLLVVAEGGKKQGLTYYELAELLLKLGAKEAMGLDSGGSSFMYVKGSIVNFPQGGRERAISNGLLLFLEINSP